MMRIDNIAEYRVLFTITVLLMFLCSCEDLVEADAPKTELVSKTVFEDDRTATAVLTGIYARMMASSGFASGFANSISVLGGLSADELVSYGFSDDFFENTLQSTDQTVRLFCWNEPYQYIYTANVVLEGLLETTAITPVVKRQLEGEARFIRAFCYFYLVNFFGDVPLHLTSDYRENSVRSRMPAAEVYQQIVADLKEAQKLLPADYAFSEGERIRPNQWAATALLARTYLYMEDWENAEIQATRVIDNPLYELPENLNEVFLKNSREAIWQLMPVQPGINTWEGFRFILVSAPPSTQGLSESMVHAFEAGDERQNKWVGSITKDGDTWYYPHKYKIRLGTVLSEYSMVLRVAEQYLIRAEARAQQNKIEGAVKDVDALRKRANLDLIADTDPGIGKSGLLEAILRERRVELFTEWSHRWLDLKRSENSDTVLGAVKPHWETTDIFYPIPLDEILRNSSITQNPGY
ncbi:SusD family protein [Sinomicrobium oceani]|uniref:SusD family protein n=1 Tax=Sinomicrobium oceani TaxID=1150368 RepID=A0A1K1RWF7_9FLAO|nr:RagB/SusD family nutrient uptake outer membrane protein [Sinomicrobium oceani]SFW76157.1 SusD family protein [Sinomicrobium oceani]